MKRLLSQLFRDRSGATAIEYSLIAAFIGLVLITVLTNVGVEVTGVFSDVDSGLKTRA